MGGKGIIVCIGVGLVAGVFSMSIQDKDSQPQKRFIVDTFWSMISASITTLSGASASVFIGECTLCKCDNTCHGEVLVDKYLIHNANETKLCGDKVWKSINCSDKHNIANLTAANANNPTGQSSCSRLCALSTVANIKPMINPNASMCLSGKRESNEALPMSCCNLDRPNSWKQGAKVMPNCSYVPQYTPLAAFIGGNLVAGSAGVFISCLDNGEKGFQMIQQKCDYQPAIIHVSTTDRVHTHPDAYHIITKVNQ